MRMALMDEDEDEDEKGVGLLAVEGRDWGGPTASHPNGASLSPSPSLGCPSVGHPPSH